MDLDRFLNKHLLVATSLHRYFYHFTDTRNIDLIRKYGLLSLRQLKEKNIEIPAPGGNELSWDLDSKNGMDAYVHLCFTRNHPMEYAARTNGTIKDVKYLKIKPEVIKVPGALIADGVANKKGVVPRPAREMLDVLDLEIIYTRTDWCNPEVKARLKAAEKFELLIPKRVPLNLIGL